MVTYSGFLHRHWMYDLMINIIPCAQLHFYLVMKGTISSLLTQSCLRIIGFKYKRAK